MDREGQMCAQILSDPSLDSGFLGLSGPWAKEAIVQRVFLQTDDF